ncbi:MAG TPA: hypothetical protein VHP83_23790, partial [Aggregatilineaceae bacterium]|nr:hypothetical protein [Aggregatilineaceae bacterium]
KNAQTVIAIELLCAYQALELRAKSDPTLKWGRGTQMVMDYLRSVEIAPGQRIAPLTRDVAMQPYLDAMVTIIREGKLLDALHMTR